MTGPQNSDGLPAPANVRPLALGYVRLPAADPPETAVRLITQMHAYADREGLTLDDVFTDVLDPPDGLPDRSGFCALMDALRRHDVYVVIIPAPDHLSRRTGGYAGRRTIIETEAGARLLVVQPALHVTADGNPASSSPSSGSPSRSSVKDM